MWSKSDEAPGTTKKGNQKSVTFTDVEIEPTYQEFLTEFSKYNGNSAWLALIFLLTSLVRYAIDMEASIFEIACSREQSCLFENINFSEWKMLKNETKQIIYPPMRFACIMYDYDVTIFKNKTYKQAKQYTNSRKTPPLKYCSSKLVAEKFTWDKKFIGSCEGHLYVKQLMGMRLIGSAFGALILGVIADLYGRKIAMYIAMGTFIFSIFTVPFVDNFKLAQFLQVLKGLGSEIIHVTLILFLELCSKHNRAILVVYLSVFGPVGVIIGVNLKRYMGGYCPALRYIAALPSLIFVFYAWYVPESPRWYLTYCRKKEAWMVLNSLGTPIKDLKFLPPIKFHSGKILVENIKSLFTSKKFLRTLLLGTYLFSSIQSVAHTRKKYRTLIVLKPYSHQALLCMARIFSFMYVLPVMIILRRQLALYWLYFLICVQLVVGFFVTGVEFYVLNVLLMFCVYSVENIFVLYMCELFPTAARGLGFGFIRCFALLMYLPLYFDPRIGSQLFESTCTVSTCGLGLIAIYFMPKINSRELPDYKRFRQHYT